MHVQKHLDCNEQNNILTTSATILLNTFLLVEVQTSISIAPGMDLTALLQRAMQLEEKENNQDGGMLVYYY